jgi:hypothetical protein
MVRSRGFRHSRHLADLAAALAMIAASGVLIWRASTGGPRPTATRAGPSAIVPYQIGDNFESAPGLSFEEAPQTLVIYLQSTCRFCTASMGFYQGLNDSRRRVPLVVVGFEAQSVLNDYVTSHGFAPDRIVTVPASTLRFGGTPTLALVDRTGRIGAIWRGQLKSDEEAEVRRSLQ